MPERREVPPNQLSNTSPSIFLFKGGPRALFCVEFRGTREEK
jgi:hypothetical protein